MGIRFGAVQTWNITEWTLTIYRSPVSGELPFADLFEPAIDYARGGFLVSPITGRGWSRAPEIYEGFSDFFDHFLPGVVDVLINGGNRKYLEKSGDH